MIESRIKNKLSLRRYRKFKSSKSAVISIIFLCICFFFSLSAEFWANDKPIVLKYNGSLYFPIVKDYHPTVFGNDQMILTDYRKLDMGEKDFAIWTLLYWNPYEHNANEETYPSAPSLKNIMGTDDRGRDVAARLLYGFRYSMTYAIFVFIISYILGIVAGAIMGYFGGLTDLLGQRVIEVWESIPVLILLLTLISIFQPNIALLIFISSLFGWMGTSTYVRAEFLKIRKMEFVEASRSLGMSNTRTIFHHVLPNSLGPIITFAPFTIASGVGALAILDFLGFGLQPPTPSWGELLAQAKNNFTIAWWLAVFPSIALFSTLLSLILIGDSVRDALDPREN